jgi:hypothetical protein
MVAQLAVREAIGGKSIDDTEDVAELVVEGGPDDALRQRAFDVGDLLAYLIPDVRYRLLRGRIQNIDVNRGRTRLGIALQVIEIWRFLQLLFDPIGDLQHRVVDRRPRPGGLHNHRLDREGRVFLAAELPVRKNPGHDE